jgi:hypothetical protein
MTSVVDTAIARIQAIALACAGINAAPTLPTANGGVLPMVITHITDGRGSPDDATGMRLLPNIAAEFIFPDNNLAATYTQIDALIPEFMQRLAGDPTLKGAVSTINGEVTFTVSDGLKWDTLNVRVVAFTIPLKFMLTPTTTA